jgi:hypothetical protein
MPMKSGWAQFLALVLVAASAAAGDVVSDLRGCATESNDSKRLACYDKLAAENANQAEAAPRVSAAEAERKFGEVSSRLPDQPRPLTQITSTVVTVDARPNDRWAVTLENAQVWEQNESTTRVTLHPGDVVTIKRGAMSAHLLIGPSKVATYVRRIR